MRRILKNKSLFWQRSSNITHMVLDKKSVLQLSLCPKEKRMLLIAWSKCWSPQYIDTNVMQFSWSMLTRAISPLRFLRNITPIYFNPHGWEALLFQYNKSDESCLDWWWNFVRHDRLLICVAFEMLKN